MPGTLYLCATPIGNLGDITQRVLDTLREVDLIAAEDTRNTLRLLNHFEIKKPMTSYHEHNKYDKARELIGRLHRGENIAVVTDAGTPAISDPGEVLAALCIEEGIRVTSLPGACALITALTMSGMPARRFCFEGFLPPEKTDKKERLELVNKFNKDKTPIFMISLKAGGTGLNLTGADVVIHYDPWWNVSAQNQATDRAHRIGQTKIVNVYKIIAKNTIEEKILKLQNLKKDLADSILDSNSKNIVGMTKEDILNLFSD